MKRIVSKKGLALLVAALLVFALLPGAALAETVENAPTLSIAAGETTQLGIDEKWGAGTVEYTSSVVDGKKVYTVKLLKNVVLKAGCDFRINEYDVGGTGNPSVILDLNGCTITSQSIGLISGGNLTIRDTSEAQTGGITYSTTSEQSSLTTISHSGGTLVIEGGTFTCEAGYAFTGYVATVSTQLGGVTYIKGGTFVSNSSAVMSSNDGKTVVEGGTFSAPYGMYVKPGTGGEPGVIEIPADSTAVINASSFAMVVQRVKGVEGGATISAEGGTFNGPSLVGGVNKPDTVSAVSLSGGTYEQNPSSWAAENTPVARLTFADRQTPFLVGEKAVADAAAGAAAGDVIEVFSGNLPLSGLPDGVKVKNSGTGTVSANGEDVAPGETVTVKSELLYSIVKQPTDSIVTEGDAATFTVVAEGRDVMLGYQWRKSTDGGKTFKVIDGANAASYTTSATTLQNDGYQYDCIVFDANWQTVRANNAPSLTDADIKDMTEGQDYLRSKAATLYVKEAGAEPEPEEPVVPPTGDSPLLYAAIGAAVLCLLGLCLPALRKNRG